jgi:hypothetical protein
MEGEGGATNLHSNCGGERCLEQLNLRWMLWTISGL